MKRLLIIGLLMLMTMSMVSAQMQTTPVKLQDQSAMQIREQVRNMTYFRQAGIQGLEQAQLVVKGETAARQIEQNIERLTQRNQEMIQRMERVQIALGENDTAIVQGRTQAKFLGFINANREMTMVVNEDGEIARVGRPLDFLFRYEETIRETQVE